MNALELVLLATDMVKSRENARDKVLNNVQQERRSKQERVIFYTDYQRKLVVYLNFTCSAVAVLAFADTLRSIIKTKKLSQQREAAAEKAKEIVTAHAVFISRTEIFASSVLGKERTLVFRVTRREYGCQTRCFVWRNDQLHRWRRCWNLRQARESLPLLHRHGGVVAAKSKRSAGLRSTGHCCLLVTRWMLSSAQRPKEMPRVGEGELWQGHRGPWRNWNPLGIVTVTGQFTRHGVGSDRGAGLQYVKRALRVLVGQRGRVDVDRPLTAGGGG